MEKVPWLKDSVKGYVDSFSVVQELRDVCFLRGVEVGKRHYYELHVARRLISI